MSKQRYTLLAAVVVLVILAAVLSAACTSAQTSVSTTEMRSYTDCLGRTLEIPLNPERVITTCPTTTTIAYMLAPEEMIGWNFVPDTRNMPAEYAALPNIGGWFGLWSGNYETMIAAEPDLVIYETSFDGSGGGDLEVLKERQKNFGSIPVVGIFDTGNISCLDENIRTVGELLGKDEKAEELVLFYQEMRNLVTSRIQDIPVEERPQVYYAETATGLKTDAEGSRHSALIPLCGGINAAEVPLYRGQGGMGQIEISIEQILSSNPDVIICENAEFYKDIYNSPEWGQLDAVKNGRVYLAPRGPFCWFDRPPGASTIIGIPWTAKVLYPELFEDVDIEALAREFYSEFLHYDLSDEDLSALLGVLSDQGNS